MDERPERATAIVILGGGLEFRPSAAARLYHEGWAPLVLAPNVEPSIAVLDRLGVPENAVESYGADVKSTYDEAEAIKAWVRGRSVERLIIPTDSFHTRRVNWVFEKSLPGIDVRVIPIDAPGYDPGRWWQQKYGRIAVRNEVIKWLYYHAKY